MPPTLSTFWSRMISMSQLSSPSASPHPRINCSSMLIRVRQQGEIARPLDRRRQLPLIRRTRARNAARDDLAGLRDVSLQRHEIFVVDLLHALGGETTELLASKITSHLPC